jgi:hypothetical protein
MSDVNNVPTVMRNNAMIDYVDSAIDRKPPGVTAKTYDACVSGPALTTIKDEAAPALHVGVGVDVIDLDLPHWRGRVPLDETLDAFDAFARNPEGWRSLAEENAKDIVPSKVLI